MSVEELIVAFVIVESCVRANRAIITTHTVRPLLLASCVLSRKLLCDHMLTLGWVRAQLSDVFTLLDVDLLEVLELQVLLVIKWRFPMRGETYQNYTDALFDAAADHCGRYIPAPLLIQSDGFPREPEPSEPQPQA